MENKKDLPPGVPKENEYHSLHWTVILAFLCASGAIYMLMVA